jgi:hypothetical protein
LESELTSAKKQIQILEKSRSENFFQLAQLTEKLNDAKSNGASDCSNALKPEQLPLKSSFPSIKPFYDWKEGIHGEAFSEQSPLFDSFLDSIGSSLNDDDTYAANGIIHDWARKNKELRDHLKNVQEELKNEVSFAVTAENPSHVPIVNHEVDKKRAVESEHQVLMDIVSRVKSDLRQAAMTSPGSPMS